ncbi:HAD family hydrolase [Varibaculum massiliense]|uniref:HAD family hydrolase n=1 Tax=Varibaculum massiliense TaxID=1852372 RepID=UPI00288A6C86|nr:HAD-IB family hydrolase [Varibaculum massiliense]
MNAETKVAAFFDLDETVIRGASSWVLTRELFRHRFFGVRDLFFAAHQAFLYVVLGEDQTRVEQVKTRALQVMAGHSQREIMEISEQVCDLLEKKLFPQAQGLIKRHQAAGHDIWLISAAPSELPQMLAQRLGLTGGIGTEVAVKDGIYEARLASELMHAQGKRDRVVALASERGYDLASCFAYSDSDNDMPLLTLVGKPSAINPDIWLRVRALQRGWPVIDFRRRSRISKALQKAKARRRGFNLVGLGQRF